ncbi:MAG: aspartate/tyrosine/aromatic aminotransferase [Parachlamydiales bacterium]|nr:aspartate/tyrosine/aromatic aminotransferase [Parachlamydiales bacterium]
MNWLDSVIEAPVDPIFGLNTRFVEDKRPHKVNLGVGSYKTEDLQSYIMPVVLKAEQLVLKKYIDKEYLPIGGDPIYGAKAAELALGKDVDKDRLAIIQTVGGEGALRLGAEFLIRNNICDTIAISDPTWPNHPPTFTSAGLKVVTYPYHDKETHQLLWEPMLESLKKLPKKSAVLLHACCHNPSGCDLSESQWIELANIMLEHELLPFFDCAYQGFGEHESKDNFSMRYFANKFPVVLYAYSFSKNFGLYAERTGAFFLIGKNPETTKKAYSQLLTVARYSYSNPPCHGARIVKEVLTDEIMTKEWHDQIKAMRDRIADMRKVFVQKMKAKGVDWSFFQADKGLFTLTGLSKNQVEELIQEHAIFMPANGRINVAGISHKNCDYIVDAFSSLS